MVDYVTIVGFVAGFLTTIALLPQVIKTWRTKLTRDISLPYFLVLTIGLFLWVVYGIFINDFPIIVANIISFIFSSTIVYFKLRYK